MKERVGRLDIGTRIGLIRGLVRADRNVRPQIESESSINLSQKDNISNIT